MACVKLCKVTVKPKFIKILLFLKNNSMRASQLATSPLSDSPLSAAIENSQVSELQFANPNDISVQSTFSTGMPISQSNPTNISAMAAASSLENREDIGPMSHSPLVKNSPSDNVQNIFLAEKQPQWFVGRVLVKEFCIARKVTFNKIVRIDFLVNFSNLVFIS